MARGLILAIIMAGCATGVTLGEAYASEKPAPHSGEREHNKATVLELRFDQAVRYRELELRLLSLADARCPTGVTCVWAGQMIATLELSRRAGVPAIDAAGIDTPGTDAPGSKESASDGPAVDGSAEVELLRKALREPVMVRAFGYELRLLGVDPHPKQGREYARSDYTVFVEIALP